MWSLVFHSSLIPVITPLLQAINKSLSCLADVFTAIGNKYKHIPFRNSKLTHLLSPCLSGDGKTLMMVNLSPTEMSYSESLCTLRYVSGEEWAMITGDAFHSGCSLK